jgi:outer membrane receptor for ferrienterochelin and colicins
MTTPSSARAALLIAFMCSAAPAFAQAQAPAAAPAAQPAAAGQGARSYTPADFVRFAPRNAFDMLSNVPGFAIDQGDTERRGLGQASGNVLINGARFSGKSTDILTELRRISASNVARIEIVDGATLNISGLSGQVANVITVSRGLSGNYVYRPQIRARRTPFRYTNGEVSVNGSAGGAQYTLSLRNDSFRNGNAGPELVTTPNGTLLDTRDEVLGVNGEQPRLSATIRRNFAGGAILNVNAAAGILHQDVEEVSLRHGAGQPDRNRDLQERTRQYDYELGGDYEFGLGGGRLKLIGLRHFTHTPFRQTLIQTFADATPTLGQRFTQVGDQTETIGRSEYRWHGGGADWQVSLEGALNRLDVENGLFELAPSGDFVAVPFPNNAATVEERRGEAMLTYGRPLTPRLTFQGSLGGEYSQLSQQGAGGLTRTFYRPKGFMNLAWQPRPGLDISARIERVVGQLNFFDFVASGNVSAGTQNAGNANLVPPQSWNAQVQAVRNLGRWGNATARLYGRLISDIVDVIPVNGGQSPGNLPGTASVYGIQWTSTFNFDPIGIPGAKLDLSLQFQKTRLTDPLTGARRPINENMTRQIDIVFRHDIPHTDLAYGAEFFQFRQSPLLRLDERWHFIDHPGSLGAYIEHKDVFGLTVRATVDNLLGTNESFGRTFYDGLRTNGVRFTENRDRFYGPIFTLTISGTI